MLPADRREVSLDRIRYRGGIDRLLLRRQMLAGRSPCQPIRTGHPSAVSPHGSLLHQSLETARRKGTALFTETGPPAQRPAADPRELRSAIRLPSRVWVLTLSIA